MADEQYIYDEIRQERGRQTTDLGYTAEHDDQHGSQWWQRQIRDRAQYLGLNLGRDYRSGLVKIGALAIAAIAKYDRNQNKWPR
jgi:hypothetical protein